MGKDPEDLNSVEDSNTSERICSKRSPLEKILIQLLVLCVILIIIFAIIVILAYGKTTNKSANELCTEEGCIIAAAKLTKSLDFSKNPCENFYEFACGNWMKQNVIPEDKSYIASFVQLRDEVATTLKYLLDQDYKEDEPRSVKTAKDLYMSCVNMEEIEQRNLSVAVTLLEKLGGWPMLGSKPGGGWESEKFSLHGLLAALMFYYNNPILGAWVSTDLKNTSRRVIYIDQPSLTMASRTYFLSGRNDRRLLAYEKLVRSVWLEFGADEDTINADIEEMIQFEIALANVTIPSEKQKDESLLYNLYRAGDLKTVFLEPTTFEFKWMEFLQLVFGMADLNMTLTEEEPVVIKEKRYFDVIFPLLERFSNRTLANYVVWCIMQNRIKNLPIRFEKLLTEFNQVLTGELSASPRWRKCTTFTNSQMTLAVGRLYVQEKFDERAKKDLNEMIDLIQGAFADLLHELEWMDPETRLLAEEKTRAMQRKIGYEDKILNDTWLENFYENFTMINKDLYFENVLTLLHLWVVGDFKVLRDPVDKDSWTSTPARVNAFYIPLRNRIVFPAGILQPPYYHRNQPKSLSFGGIGTLIGHEITHGFDASGRQYDKEGNLNQWWSDEVIERFENISQCFVEQYNKFVVPEADNMTINGVQTLGENIADNGGIRQAFKAYNDWLVAHGGSEPRLPGVNLTHEQLFFVNFAQIRCSNHRDADKKHMITNGVHTLPKYRVTGTLQNFPEFSRVFHCPVGSLMNPERKCRLW